MPRDFSLSFLPLSRSKMPGRNDIFFGVKGEVLWVKNLVAILQILFIYRNI